MGKSRIEQKYPTRGRKKKPKEDYWSSLKKKKGKKHPPKKKAKKKFIPKWKSYKDYLKSKEWRAIRARVLTRSNGICELCKMRKAYQVHHKHYRRIFRERLSDLVAVCGICHQDQHKLLSDTDLERTVNELMEREGYATEK